MLVVPLNKQPIMDSDVFSKKKYDNQTSPSYFITLNKSFSLKEMKEQ